MAGPPEPGVDLSQAAANSDPRSSNLVSKLAYLHLASSLKKYIFFVMHGFCMLQSETRIREEPAKVIPNIYVFPVCDDSWIRLGRENNRLKTMYDLEKLFHCLRPGRVGGSSLNPVPTPF